MSHPEGDPREAAERNAAAVVSGNLAQVMSDLTPDALGQLMQLGASGGMSPATMPGITGYELHDMGEQGDGHVFYATFTSPSGSATLAATWKAVMGQWKVASVSLVAADPGANA